MEIFVIYREFVDGHIDIAGPAFVSREDATTRMEELLALEEIREAVIHPVYLTLDPVSGVSQVPDPLNTDYLYGVAYEVSSND